MNLNPGVLLLLNVSLLFMQYAAHQALNLKLKMHLLVAFYQFSQFKQRTEKRRQYRKERTAVIISIPYKNEMEILKKSKKVSISDDPRFKKNSEKTNKRKVNLQLKHKRTKIKILFLFIIMIETILF